ncbi:MULTISPECIES: TAT-dependent nitrous-oxide reductase [unclassified Halorubrum]|jgi:nitrous-oxide reductase|uniref:TAT-dependent nitrous-oxide reductase n=1 Tax=unclassified Halorubrum TaxID=2642239 RepID=UPI000EF18A0A|nr:MULTISPECIES: TAT-dependent nitrous-oxide reductase [unclassified Halorubrum]RLM51501.1 nitrous-oxide reductase [Halorubrum sp. Atlit-28R]TKX46098.1 nitrous-oxide reductase [Halorubrum sp. ARQ200]
MSNDTQRSTDAGESGDQTTDSTDGFDSMLPGVRRRDFMKAGAAAGGLSGLAGCTSILSEDDVQGTASASGVDNSVPPGEHDEYYALLSGGQAGDVRVYGLPSMRELIRIPVFNRDASRGYGFDDESKQMLEDAGGYTWGDTHHPRISQTDGDYDGRFAYVNDKANGRMARIDLTYFETDAIVNIPNQQGTHGACAQLPDTDLIFGVGEFRTPVPNDGSGNLEDPDSYGSVLAAINPESMNVEWEVLIDGNMDNGDGSKEGRYFFTSAYNTEEAATESGMTRADRDDVKAFDIPRIEAAVEAGNYEMLNGVPVVDGRKDSPLNQGDEPIVHYIPTPKSPHGVSVTPDNEYVIVSGKLDPTASVIDIDKIDEVDDPTDAIVGQPKLGLGPLHTAYDGRGHAYTTLFIDSQVVKWDIEEAVEAEARSESPVIEKIDVHYNPGHLIAAESYTEDPAGDWLVSLNKLSKDRFLPVGPQHPENDQLIYIGDDENGMELVKDSPAQAEPHDASICHKSKIDPKEVYDPEDLELSHTAEGESTMERVSEDRVEIEMYSTRNHYGFQEMVVREGDEVEMQVTNIETTSDMLHSVAIPDHDVHMRVAPQETRKATFTADDPGVYWVYCAHFCSALHLEMRSRLIVKPEE